MASTSTTTAGSNTAESPVRNGVDTAALFATIGVVDAQRDLARFQFRASSTWMNGTHSRTTLSTFSGAGQEHEHKNVSQMDVDHPMVLVGTDKGPTPVEYLLVGLAGCLTAGIANIAAARRVTLRSVTASVEGDIDLQGILGLSDNVRNGYEQIRVHFDIDADATDEKIRQIVSQSQQRSAVFDVLTNGVPVTIDVTTPSGRAA